MRWPHGEEEAAVQAPLVAAVAARASQMLASWLRCWLAWTGWQRKSVQMRQLLRVMRLL